MTAMITAAALPIRLTHGLAISVPPPAGLDAYTRQSRQENYPKQPQCISRDGAVASDNFGSRCQRWRYDGAMAERQKLCAVCGRPFLGTGKLCSRACSSIYTRPHNSQPIFTEVTSEDRDDLLQGDATIVC
jgi:hypothetical protein